MGMEDREGGILEERCIGCGDCLLALTGGVCPFTRCAKGLLNGACGGARNGKCELSPDRYCAWELIFERLEKKGKLDNIREFRPPRNYQVKAWRLVP
jgi:Fe-S-cluster-containing hydrogenase component 2